MPTERYLIIFARILAGLTFAVGGLWLKWWYAAFSQGFEVPIVLFVIPIGLHFLATYTGLRGSLGGIVGMVLYTVMSFIAAIFLNIPVRPHNWIYFVLIGGQLVLLSLYLALRGRFISSEFLHGGAEK